MKSHDLARLLLEQPNLPIATHANNHTYMSKTDRRSHGSVCVGLLHTYGGEHIVIGNFSKMDLNGSNWHVTKMIHGKAE